jgi:hypothetical protein
MQTPLFAGAQDAIWGSIRRHIEGLLPDPADPPERPPTVRNGHEPHPTPEALAAQLIRERNAQSTGWLMERFRRIERATLLLVASLVPGVGERQVAAGEAAREAAEQAARENEERLRAEAERREKDAAENAGQEVVDEEEEESRRLSGVATEEAGRAHDAGDLQRMEEILEEDEARVYRRIKRMQARGEAGSSSAAAAATGRDDNGGDGAVNGDVRLRNGTAGQG